MSKAEITAAITDYKEKKAKSQPDVVVKVAEMENMEYLRSKGMKLTGKGLPGGGF